MAAEQLATLVLQALQLALWLSLPALAASLIAGAVTATLQAVTQVQDPVLSFVPRLLAVAGTLLVSATWMGDRLLAFASAVLRGLPQ